MSGYKITRLLLFISMVSFAIVYLKYGIVFIYPMVFFILLFLTIATIGAFRMRVNFFLKSICSVRTGSNKISITFDDGPHPMLTPAVLDVLKIYEAKATFFCIGNKIESGKKIVERTIYEGHQVENHSFNHSAWFDFYSFDKMKQELEQTQTVLQEVTGKIKHYFRPPYGVTTPTMEKVIAEMGLKVIGWNKRSFDTVTKDEDKVMARVTKGLKGGDIVLFHDTNPHIISILKRFLEYCQNSGLEPVTIDELLKTQYE